MVTGDLLNVTWEQEMFNISLSNVFNYRVGDITTEPAPTLADFASAFVTTVVTPILQLQDDELHSVAVRIRNLTDETEIYDLPVSGSGVNDGLPLIPRWTAYFRLNRSSAQLRPGRKSISGIAEAMVDRQTYAAAFNAKVADVEEALAATITLGVTEVRPIVLRIEPGVLPSDFAFAYVTSAQFIAWGTQNSRER